LMADVVPVTTLPNYSFSRFLLDQRRGALLADGEEIPLRAKSFALLRHFVENAERVIDRDEIMRSVWPGVFVGDDNIAQCVMEIRRALEDQHQTLLRTVPRRGYRLSAIVLRLDEFHAPEAVPKAAANRPIVSVQPFVDTEGNPETAYFAAGLTTDLVADLTRFQDLRVVNPGPNVKLVFPIETAAYAVSGSLRRSASRLRASVQLDHLKSGERIWADRFDRELTDLFALQDDLADHIAAMIADHIGRDILYRVRQRPPASFSAYDWMLQGRDRHGRTTEADTHVARRMFEKAIAADDEYAAPYAHLAYVAQRGFTLGWGEPRGRVALDVALKLAQRALAIDPQSSLCLMRLAFILSLLDRGPEAVASGRRGVMANPCDAWNRHTYGEILSRTGFHADGAAELQHAISLNPFHPPFWHATLGRALLLAGHSEDALTQLRLSAALAPDYRPAHSTIVVACVETGRTNEARQAMREVMRLRPGCTISLLDGVFGLHREDDNARFVSAFRAAGMPEH
jgi:TolB-like protein